MAYSPFNWLEGIGKVGPTNLNHLELGLQAAAVVGDAAIPKPAGPATNAGLVWNGVAWTAAKLVDANIDAAAAIASTKIAVPYTAYGPTWTSSGTAPAIGNSTVVARYGQIGKIVHAFGKITFGGSATFGTGNYDLALPVAARAADFICGSSFIYDASATAMGQTPVYLDTTTKMNFQFGATYLGVNTVLGATAPWAWAVNDIIFWNIVYEAA